MRLISLINKAKEYKTRVASTYTAIMPEEIEKRFLGERYYASRKIDGEFNLLYFDKQTICLANGSGVIKDDLPILQRIKKLLEQRNITQLLCAVELFYVEERLKRERVFELMSALKDATKREKISVAIFDLLEIDNQNVITNDYLDTLEFIGDFLPEYLVPYSIVEDSAEGISTLFEEEVLNGFEGLVIRETNSKNIYKLKPTHNIDCCVMGYSLENGLLRSMLLGVTHQDGTYQIVGSIGNRAKQSLLDELHTQLQKIHVDSQALISDKRGVAYQMVSPDLILEIKFNELITENTKGAIRNRVLSFEKSEYVMERMANGVSILHPVLESIRYDKPKHSSSVRFSQISDLVEIMPSSHDTLNNLPKSEYVEREVFVKMVAGKELLQKYVIIKTNKQASEKFPAYVLFYINVSANREEKIKKEILVSSSLEQIKLLKKGLIVKNVKKGWVKI